jgi:hypothetical protein
VRSARENSQLPATPCKPASSNSPYVPPVANKENMDPNLKTFTPAAKVVSSHHANLLKVCFLFSSLPLFFLFLFLFILCLFLFLSALLMLFADSTHVGCKDSWFSLFELGKNASIDLCDFFFLITFRCRDRCHRQFVYIDSVFLCR